MSYPFDRYHKAELERRSGVKWRRDGPAVLPAWIADMDFPIAPEIAAALHDVMARGDLGYPDPSLELAVREAYADRAIRRYALPVAPERVILTSDVVQAIYLSLLAFTQPGDGVVFLTPAYPPFFTAIAETNRRALPCDLVNGLDRYELDPSRLREVVRAGRARLLLLCNPHNPTGRSFSETDLAEIAQIAAEYDLVVVSDEIHADLTLPGAEHVAFGSLGPDAAARTITLSSASKAFNLAGLRCAVAAFGTEQLLAEFERHPARARGAVSVLGMVGTLAAWEHGEEWLTAALQVLSENRDLVQLWGRSHLGRGATHRPEATYLAWLDLRRSNLGDDPALWLREHALVALSPGPEFGLAGQGHARLNFATPPVILEEILERLSSALDDRSQRSP